MHALIHVWQGCCILLLTPVLFCFDKSKCLHRKSIFTRPACLVQWERNVVATEIPSRDHTCSKDKSRLG